MIMFFIRRMRSQNALIRLSKVVEHRLSVAKHDEIYKECVRCGLGSALAKFHVHTSCSFSKKKKVSDEQSKAQELSYISTKKRKKVIEIWPRMTVEELSRAMKKTTDNVLELMTFVDDTAGITNASDVIDDWDTLCDVVVKANFRWKVCSRPSEKQRMNAVADLSATLDADSDRRTVALSEELLKRPPVVAIMGHVDHGKTTLLDYLRKSSIAASEFGGITQHIGAFSVKVGSSSITFLDTPGHAAFSAMRSRGAHCTDIVVLVVAADDGVMEQTVESIRMANDANVPIVIAINKIDKPSADIEKTKKMLTIQGLVLEEYGGDVQVIPISALHGTNISQLIEAILILSELHDLKAPVTGLVEGVILESKLDRHKGKLTTALIQRGTLRKGDILTAGLAWCKVKKLSDDRSRQITEASPSTPVEIIGWDSLPSPGDLLTQVESEQTAHEVTRFRRKNRLLDKAVNDLPFIESARAETRAYYEEHLVEKRRKRHAQIRWDEFRQKEIEKHVKETPTLNIVVKTDVEGSLEAIADMLRTYRCSLCDLNVVQSGVGNVSLADVEIAASFHAVVYSFNVGVLADAQDYANRHDIIIKHQNVVYQFLEDVKNEMNSRLPPKDVEEIIGEAIVQELFLISEGKKKKIPVAGCRCTKGELKKSSLYKVIRNDKELHRGTLSSMRNIKVEVTSVKKDQHCGLKFNDSSVIFQPGDIIKAYKMSQVPQKIEWNPF